MRRFHLCLTTSLLLAAGCERKAERGAVVGLMPYSDVVHAYLQEDAAVRFLQVAASTPKVRFFNTSIRPWIEEARHQPAFASDGDFEVRIRVEDVPADAAFVTAFGIPEFEVAEPAGISASYEIHLDGELVASREIPSFESPEAQIWYEERIDLTSVVGRSGVIELRASVRADERAVVRGWADPRVIVDRQRPWTDASPERPNVLVVLVDTLRAENLGCYGYDRDTSPNLDAFARRSRLYENAIAPASWTAPSTATLFTGQYPLRHGVIDSVRNTLALEKRTLAEHCAESGLITGAFIANPLVTRSKNFDQGFVEFVTRRSGRAAKLVDDFETWLNEVERGRFFGYLHFFDPHSPYKAPEKHVQAFARTTGDGLMERFKEIHGPVNMGRRVPDDEDRRAARFAIDQYDAEIHYWDEQFGRLLGLLEARGLLDETIVVVTSDHGEEFLEHDLIGHGHTLYDTEVRVPLVFGGPGIEPGRVAEQVGLVSVAPTVLALAGVEAPAHGFDGPSLFEPDAVRHHEVTYTHTANAIGEGPGVYCELFAVRTDRWKFVFDPLRERRRLFDLRADPGESNDLAAKEEHRQPLRRLEERLEKWLAAYQDLSPGASERRGTEGMDEETIQNFRELGYLSDE